MVPAPAILLLDKPFEGSTPIVVTRFIEAVKKIKGRSITGAAPARDPEFAGIGATS